MVLDPGPPPLVTRSISAGPSSHSTHTKTLKKKCKKKLQHPIDNKTDRLISEDPLGPRVIAHTHTQILPQQNQKENLQHHADNKTDARGPRVYVLRQRRAPESQHTHNQILKATSKKKNWNTPQTTRLVPEDSGFTRSISAGPPNHSTQTLAHTRTHTHIPISSARTPSSNSKDRRAGTSSRGYTFLKVPLLLNLLDSMSTVNPESTKNSMKRNERNNYNGIF